jgi:GTP cyclohydrolase III
VTIVNQKLKDIGGLSAFLGGGSFDAVIDNNSKEVDEASAIAAAVKVRVKVRVRFEVRVRVRVRAR